MLRIAVISSLILAACDVGEIPGAGVGDGGNGSTDGSGSGSDCENISASPPDGHHNEGMGCQTTGGCHNAALTPGGPAFSVAGTIYKDTAGTIPYAGATVLVTVNGMTKKTIAATNGNFWFVPALLPAPTTTATGTTKASACPTTLAMGGQLVNGGGNCNNCHRAAGGTTSPIYVTP